MNDLQNMNKSNRISKLLEDSYADISNKKKVVPIAERARLMSLLISSTEIKLESLAQDSGLKNYLASFPTKEFAAIRKYLQKIK